MLPLLVVYRDFPTLKNAKRVQAYAHKHPFAACLLPAEFIDIMNHAVKVARGIIKLEG
jgi:hypothetical protein